MFNVKGKTVLITGASAGIGAHLSAVFARHGCNVVAAARRGDKIKALVDSLEFSGDGARGLGLVMDVTDRDSVEQAVKEAVGQFGGIDILINNAGIARTAKLIEMGEDDWQAVVDTNLSAVWRVGQVAARQMLGQADGGAIVNIASVLGFVPQRQNANYGAAKSGVVHLTKSMALEFGRKGIRVNAIAPGYFETDINREFFSSERGRQYLQKLYPGRAGELSELDGPVLLLASDAGSYINGTVITVDGGTLLSGI